MEFDTPSRFLRDIDPSLMTIEGSFEGGDYEHNRSYTGTHEWGGGFGGRRPGALGRMQNSRPVATQFMADEKPKITSPRRPLHVVDVNSGNRTRSAEGQEANVLEVNLGAADELARQLRLRDMGGIIVVDFIDMNLAEDRQMLYERMCKNMQQDRARHNILPLSKFGLMQITRQRVRPAMDVSVEETCPTCFGKGTIKSSILFTDQLESKIDNLVNKIGVKKFYLHVHPYVAAYINQGFMSLKRRWQMKYGMGVRVVSSQKLAFLQYEFYDANKQFIDMKEEIETK